MLTIKGLRKSYGSTLALQDLTLSVASGKIVFLVGPSGCGKSTGLRLIANLDVADNGVVHLDGRPSSDYGAALWRTLVTYVPQSRVGMTGTPLELFNRVQQFTARSASLPNGTSHELLHRVNESRNVTEKRFVDVARSLGLEEAQLQQNWSELSGGQNQRASLALAISMASPVLLLDEPTSACDPHSTLMVERAVVSCGSTVIWVSHDPDQPKRVGGRVYDLAMLG